MEKVTILEATKKWVGEFNAINQSLLSRLMQHEIDNWIELTKVSVGEYASFYADFIKDVNGEEFYVSGTYEVLSNENGIVTIEVEVDGEDVEIQVSEDYIEVERDSYLPMWGTMWSFGESLDEHWVHDNLHAMSNCGFRIYEDCETGDIYFGIDGMGYDFYEAHWIPLYKARGLQWHDKDEN